jgi:hypothetical protein
MTPVTGRLYHCSRSWRSRSTRAVVFVTAVRSARKAQQIPMAAFPLLSQLPPTPQRSGLGPCSRVPPDAPGLCRRCTTRSSASPCRGWRSPLSTASYG